MTVQAVSVDCFLELRRVRKRQGFGYRARLALTASAAAALCFTPSVMAQTNAASSVQLYGQMALAMTVNTNQAGGHASKDIANSPFSGSLFGFRGSEDLGGGMSTVFRLESGLNADTGASASSTKFWNRQSFVGLNLNPALTVTVGRQFHAGVDRVIQTLDVYNVGGTRVATAPNALFGVHRFAGNDARVDDSVKLRFRGPAGLTAGVSAALKEGAGRSHSFDLAQITPHYSVAAWFVNYDGLTVVPRTGAYPQHQAWGIGGNAPLGPVRLYLGYTDSMLTSAQQPAAPAALLATQKNRIVSLGASWQATPNTEVKAALFHDKGTSMNGVVGRDGNKQSAIVSAEYYLSKRTSLQAGVFTSHFTDGYKLDPLNTAVMGRDPKASSTSGMTVGIRHVY